MAGLEKFLEQYDRAFDSAVTFGKTVVNKPIDFGSNIYDALHKNDRPNPIVQKIDEEIEFCAFAGKLVSNGLKNLVAKDNNKQ